MQLLYQVVSWLVPAVCGGAATLTAVVRKEGLDMPVVLQDLIDWLVPFLAGGVASGIAFAVKWGRALN